MQGYGRANVTVSLAARNRSRRGFFGWRGSVSTPIEHRIPRGLGHGLALGFFVAVAAVGFAMGGHAEAFRTEYGEPQHAFARLLGLGISRVEIKGVAELDQREILEAAGITYKTSLAFLDASEVRRKLEALPLVKEASVRKLYPSELAITVKERQPAALWQKHGELFVVAADGTVIDRVVDMRFARLPFVVGDGANARSAEYMALIERAGALRGRIRAGTLEAGRRWTLKLDNGLDVKLPERGAAEALTRFAVLERDSRLSDRDILSVDMRQPDRIVVRQTVEAAAARAEALKKKAKPAKGADVI
ncbi:cell division protein FtsQ/DivIB [Chelatococcus reniformis]|uniref:cell division protein FtsQ/DivIB n=1 Tax=Chelatococcus reniformis TaxID=1494448 RepID=UPI001FCEB9F2|nr:FtsQ-type POTRA domain-containing protein [Chelatococcus reniformis]